MERSALKSQRLRNPFLLKIDSKSLSIDNYTDGLELNIVCECSFWIFSFWAVNINKLHQKLALSWDVLKNQLIDGKFIENFASYTNDPELYVFEFFYIYICIISIDFYLYSYKDEYNKITHKITSPERLDRSALGSNQRSSYPLVVMMAINDKEIEDQIEINDIVRVCNLFIFLIIVFFQLQVLRVSIIHVKDNIIPLETSIIAQYIKRKSGIVLNLQDLYVSVDSCDNMPYCVICQENYITRALLPCKHACVCAECFPRVELCPLCRSAIQSFILFNQTQQPKQIDESNDQGDENKPEQNRSSNSWFSKFTNLFNSNN